MEEGGRNESWDVDGVKTACLNLIILKRALRKKNVGLKRVRYVSEACVVKSV